MSRHTFLINDVSPKTDIVVHIDPVPVLPGLVLGFATSTAPPVRLHTDKVTNYIIKALHLALMRKSIQM